MLPIKRLLYVLFIVLVVSALFLMYNLNEERASHIDTQRLQEAAAAPLEGPGLDGAGQLRFLVAGDPGKDLYQDIYQNVTRVLSDLKLPYTTADTVSAQMLQDDTILILCDDTAGEHVDLLALGQFIENGGRVLFAAGLPEAYTDAYLWPFLGIQEKSIKENYNDLAFVDGLFPLQYDRMVYDGYNASTWISVDENARVYIQDAEKQVPVLYTYDFGAGKACLINGTFLADINCCGLLTGALGLLADDFVYPVLGVKAVFLDNFPMVTFVNDKLCMKLYGCSTEAFVRDVVWPQFQGLALRQDVRYTSAILAIASGDNGFAPVEDSLFTAIGRSALQYDGELAFAADCRPGEPLVFNEELVQEFRQVFDRYQINALALMNGTALDPAMLRPDGVALSAVRGSLADTDPFAVATDYFFFPCATTGNRMDEGNLFEITSVLSAYGMLSHAFDVNRLIALDEGTASWDLDKDQIGVFETQVLSQVGYLEPKTLSNTQNAVASYRGLSYEWYREGDRIHVNCTGALQGQGFCLRTGAKITGAQGASYQEMGNGYYLLRMEAGSATIDLA